MKKWFVTSLLAVLLLAGSAFGVFRLHQKQQWTEAYNSANDAFRRAYDYRNAGDLLYEPRFKDFEAAEDSFERLAVPVKYEPTYRHPASIKSENAYQLRLCSLNLQIYRTTQKANEDAATYLKSAAKCLASPS